MADKTNYANKVCAVFVIGIAITFVYMSGVIEAYFSPKSMNPDDSDDSNQTTDLNQLPPSTGITLIVDFANGTKDIIVDIIAESPTTSVFDILDKYYSIAFDTYQMGEKQAYFVHTINGVSNGGSYYWQYWVNNTYSNKGCNLYIPANYDVIEWKFTDSYY